MDFYNFAGLHRDVVLYIKPIYSIQDIAVETEYDASAKFGQEPDFRFKRKKFLNRNFKRLSDF